MTADEVSLLSKGQRRAYALWLAGEDLAVHYGRTTVWKYIDEVYKRTGIDMSGHRRPEALPAINLADFLVPANIVPIPHWAHGHPRYWAPGDAVRDFERTREQAVAREARDTESAAKLIATPNDDELDRLAY